MMLGIEVQLLIVDKIKRINKIADYQKRVDEFIAVRQELISNICDELDDMFAAVDLTNKQHNEQQVSSKVVQLSIAFDEEQQEQMDYELLCDNVGKQVDDLYWYDREILKLYIELGNYRAIEKKTGIPYASAYKTVQKVIKEIKQKVLR
jgi:hypothetical protein